MDSWVDIIHLHGRIERERKRKQHIKSIRNKHFETHWKLEMRAHVKHSNEKATLRIKQKMKNQNQRNETKQNKTNEQKKNQQTSIDIFCLQ